MEKTIMTPDEFAEKMQKIEDEGEGDTEYIHRDMDSLMIEMLKQLGYEKGATIREELSVWYA